MSFDVKLHWLCVGQWNAHINDTDITLDLMKGSLVQPAIATGMTATMTLLQDTMSNLERIRNTPLPFAYQTHLRLSLWWVDCLLALRIWFLLSCSWFLGCTCSSCQSVSMMLSQVALNLLYPCMTQFQVYAAYGYLTIPGTAFASFLLLGFLEIGQEMYVSLSYSLLHEFYGLS